MSEIRFIPQQTHSLLSQPVAAVGRPGRPCTADANASLLVTSVLSALSARLVAQYALTACLAWSAASAQHYHHVQSASFMMCARLEGWLVSTATAAGAPGSAGTAGSQAAAWQPDLLPMAASWTLHSRGTEWLATAARGPTLGGWQRL